MKFQKNAFTLVELSIVMMILTIIALLFSSVDFSSQNYAEKRDRMVGKVSDIIRSVRTVSTSGKSFSGTTAVCSDFAITFTTGSITTEFVQISDTGSTIATCGTDTEHSLSSPLFNEPGYAIKYMTGADASGTQTFCMGDCGTTNTSKVKLIVKNGEIRIHPFIGGIEDTSNTSITFGARATFLEGAGVTNENVEH